MHSLYFSILNSLYLSPAAVGVLLHEGRARREQGAPVWLAALINRAVAKFLGLDVFAVVVGGQLGEKHSGRCVKR